MHQKSILAAFFLAAAALVIDLSNPVNRADDAGSTNLLLFAGTLRELAATCSRTIDYMSKNGIDKLYPGHYHGDNPETLQRLLDERKMAQEVLSGKRKGTPDSANGNLNRYVRHYGVTIRYNDPDAFK